MLSPPPVTRKCPFWYPSIRIFLKTSLNHLISLCTASSNLVSLLNSFWTFKHALVSPIFWKAFHGPDLYPWLLSCLFPFYKPNLSKQLFTHTLYFFFSNLSLSHSSLSPLRMPLLRKIIENVVPTKFTSKLVLDKSNALCFSTHLNWSHNVKASCSLLPWSTFLQASVPLLLFFLPLWQPFFKNSSSFFCPLGNIGE